MSEQHQKRWQQGFTIIEIMIVLAIAGLILLLIFQAIPTLQRNSRNDQRRQDVAAILGGVSHYALNHSGAMPDDCGGGSGQSECTAPGGPLEHAHLSYYYEPDASSEVNISIKSRTETDGVPGVPDDIHKVAVYNRLRCDTDNPGQPTKDAAGFRNVVALFSVESGNNAKTKQCQEL